MFCQLKKDFQVTSIFHRLTLQIPGTQQLVKLNQFNVYTSAHSLNRLVLKKVNLIYGFSPMSSGILKAKGRETFCSVACCEKI